ncbi:hypothetical protein V1519DRAFT_446388 [Lipomyces tetrasporus]
MFGEGILPRTDGDEDDIAVAVMGSVMEKYSGFRVRVQEFLNLLGRRRGKKLVLAVTEDRQYLGQCCRGRVQLIKYRWALRG